MAQPRTYTRQFNFNDFQTTSPANPLPGVQVDTELNTVKLTLDDLNTNIAKIQQDDGKIKNQSVHKDSFDAGALALMKTGSYSIQGDWNASRAYAVGDLVDNNGATYVATVAHTSSSAFETDLTANNWILIANAGIANTASTVDKFEGTGSQTAFTLSSSYTSNTDVMVFVNGALKNPGDDFSISTNTLTFVTAPSTPAVSGNENVIVFGTSVVAQAAKEAAQLAQTNASGFANEADNWARLTTGLVESTDYSSKAYAIGGTGVDNGSGSAKDWATKTSGTVGNTGEYSAKYYATNANVGTVATNIASVNSLAAVATEIGLLGNSSNITAMGHLGTSANVTAMGVLGTSTNVTNMANLNATGVITNIANLNASGVIANIGTTAGISTDVTTVANISSDVTSLANSLQKSYAVTVANPGSGNVFVLGAEGNAPAIEVFRGNSYIFDQSDSTNDGHPLVFKNGSSAYETGVKYFLNGSETTQANYVNVTTFNAGRSSGVRKVEIEVDATAPSSGLRYYCYVHGNGMGNTITVKDSNISLVAGSIANVNNTGNDIANVNLVGGSIANVNLVGTNITGVNSFADRYRVGATNPTSNNDAGDLFFNTTSNELLAHNGSTFQPTAPSAANQTNINIVAGEITAQEDLGSITSAINTSSGNNINTVANAITNVTTLGTTANVANMATLSASGVVANIASVAGAVSNVNTVATNLTGINSFAERYRVASSAPTSSLDAGDLYFNTTTNSLNYYNGSAFVAVVAGAMTSLLVDSTPQLGGNLDVNGNSIVSASNGDITIAPNGSGEINLNGTVNTDNLTIDFGSIA